MRVTSRAKISTPKDNYSLDTAAQTSQAQATTLHNLLTPLWTQTWIKWPQRPVTQWSKTAPGSGIAVRCDSSTSSMRRSPRMTPRKLSLRSTNKWPSTRVFVVLMPGVLQDHSLTLWLICNTSSNSNTWSHCRRVSFYHSETKLCLHRVMQDGWEVRQEDQRINRSRLWSSRWKRKGESRWIVVGR